MTHDDLKTMTTSELLTIDAMTGDALDDARDLATIRPLISRRKAVRAELDRRHDAK